MAKKKDNSKERRESILHYIQNAGSFGIPRSVVQEISKRFGCSERMVYLDVHKVIETITFPTIKKLSKQFYMSFNHGMNTAHRLTLSSDPYIQARGIALLNQTISNFTEFLEKFGLKEKIAEQLEIKGTLATTEEQRIYQKYYGDENAKTDNTESGNQEQKCQALV